MDLVFFSYVIFCLLVFSFKMSFFWLMGLVFCCLFVSVSCFFFYYFCFVLQFVICGGRYRGSCNDRQRRELIVNRRQWSLKRIFNDR